MREIGVVAGRRQPDTPHCLARWRRRSVVAGSEDGGGVLTVSFAVGRMADIVSFSLVGGLKKHAIAGPVSLAIVFYARGSAR